MGYYSEVAITLFEDDFESLVKISHEKSNEAFDLIRAASIHKYKNEPTNIIVIAWDYVKWYDGYKDVDFIMSFVGNANREYHYIRAGEEVGDVEIRANDRLGILSEIAQVEQYITISTDWAKQMDTKSFIDKILDEAPITNSIDEDGTGELSEAKYLNMINTQ